MAEFCLDCWNKLMESNDPPDKYILSRHLELCEECTQQKHVIIAVRKSYVLKDCFKQWFTWLKHRQDT